LIIAAQYRFDKELKKKVAGNIASPRNSKFRYVCTTHTHTHTHSPQIIFT
jgi:hypothetical protein